MKPEEKEISFADSDFVIKHQESEVSMLNSDLAKSETGLPFSISNDFNVKIAIMVRGNNSLELHTVISSVWEKQKKG